MLVFSFISVISMNFNDLFCPSFPKSFNRLASILFKSSPFASPPHNILKLTYTIPSMPMMRKQYEAKNGHVGEQEVEDNRDAAPAQIVGEGAGEEVEEAGGCEGAEGEVEEEGVEPGLALEDGVDGEEGQGVAEEDRPLDDAQRQVDGHHHHQRHRHEVGILILQEVEHAVQEDARVATRLREHQLRQKTKQYQDYICTQIRVERMIENIPPISFSQNTMGFTSCICSYILNKSQQSLCVYSSLSMAFSSSSNLRVTPRRSKKPSAELTLLNDRLSFSSSRSSLTVSTFRKSPTFLASAVLRNLGLLTNSRMSEMGRAVSPQAPQQARMVQPMRQKKATTKQMTLLEKCRCSSLMTAPSALLATEKLCASTSTSSTGMAMSPQKAHPTPKNSPNTPSETAISKAVHSVTFQQGSSWSRQQSEVAMGLRKARLTRRERQSASQSVVRSLSLPRLLATSSTRKKGWNCVCRRVITMSTLQKMLTTLKAGSSRCEQNTRMQKSTSRNSRLATTATTIRNASVFNYKPSANTIDYRGAPEWWQLGNQAIWKYNSEPVTCYNMIKALLLLVLPALLLVAQAQILAIDYGTQYIKASLVHAGAGKSFSIVENPKSQRKFINSLGLYNEERFYEADTLTKRSRGPKNCFIYSRLLIDLHDQPTALETVRKDLILDYLAKPEADQLLVEFVLAGFPEDQAEVSLLETVAMMLRYVRREAEKAAKGAVKDVVLVVPCHWTIHQRKFLVRAAELADLYVLSLIHENTAAAINYALTQRHTNNTETILFYNLGANAVQMTLAQFKQVKSDKTKPVESIFILGDYGRPYMGGLRFDSMIAGHFTKVFEGKYKRSLSQRGQIRLLAESEKIKLVLSANKEATVFVEGIMDGIDFSATMTRKQFEQLAEDTLAAATAPLKRFLFDHDLRPEDLHAVELIGGGSRVPRLQTLLGEALGNNSLVGAHINGDESMVLGAAFHGANSSKKFKVKGINLYDGFNFEMRIVLRNAEEDIDEQDSRYFFKNVTLFKKKSRYGLTKEVSFKCRENLLVEIYKEDEEGLELLTRHRIDSVNQINETSFKLSLTFEIHPLDIVRLNEAKYLYSKDIVQSYTEKVRKPKNKTQEEPEETEEEKETEDKEEESKEEEDSSQKSSSKSEKKKKKEKVEYETVERFRNVTKNFDKELSFKADFHVYGEESKKSFDQSQKLFARYESKEAVKRQLAESKNKLEALIYEIREKIESDEFVKYAQDSEKERLRTLLEEKAAWYEETSSSIADDYFKEHKELNAPVEKIKKRMVEHREREDVRKRALELVEEYAKLATKVQKGKAWITDEEVATLSKNITAAKDNIKNLYQKLTSLKLNEDSVVHNKDLIKAADIAKDYYFLLKGKSKPKDWKDESKAKGEDEKKEEKKEEESKEEESEGETDSKDDQVNEDEL